MPKNPDYLAPVTMTYFWCKREYNKKFKAYDLTIGKDEMKWVQPFGANGFDADNIYPVPYVWKQTKDILYVKYHGVGMGDGPWKREFWRTEKAARKAALEWLGDRTEMTEEQKAEAARDVKMKELKEARKHLADLEENVMKWKGKVKALEKELGA